MIARILDWLANAKSENEDISSDALRIASLEAANADLSRRLLNAHQDTAQAVANAVKWMNKYQGAEAALKTARAEIEELEANEETNWPLVSYALRQKANRARYDAKRRGK